MRSVAGLRVRDVMTPDPITAKLDVTVVELARLMAENNIGSVIIVDDNNTPIGIVTEDDLVKRVLARARDPATTTAQDIMSTPLIYVEPDTLLKDAADLMARKGVGHLPVIQGNKLLGIIAEYDIVRLAPQFIEILYIRR